MKIKKLIKQLKKLEKENGNVPVYVWADHGQMCLAAGGPVMRYVDEDGEEIADEDIGEYDANDLCRAVVIDGV